MRSRPTARSEHALPPSNTIDQSTVTIEDDEVKKQQAPKKSKFRLPPPPKLSYTKNSSNGYAESADTVTKPVNASNDVEMGSDSTLALSASTNVQSQRLLSPSILIPPSRPQHIITSAYQRKHSSSNNNPDKSTVIIESGNEDASNVISMRVSTKPSVYNNPYQSYKPSHWYSNARRIQKTQRRLQNAFLLLVASISLALLGWNLHHMHKEESIHRHHNYHHHDKKKHLFEHNHLHAMIGIIDNPAGFALYSHPIDTKHRDQQDESLPDEKQFVREPTVTLSNGRLLPKLGFGVAGRQIEHKEIPLIVSKLLQYTSSENEGGSSIVMIDAVIDQGIVQHDDKSETDMSKKVVALIGKAINIFAKDTDRVVNANSISNEKSHDDENRLEVHLLIGLTGSELGRDNTLKLLSELTVELDGLVPPIRDLEYFDVSSWKANVHDRQIDLRLNVLLHLPECYDDIDKVVPCSLDETSNLQQIQSWIDSWGVLEKLYEKGLVHGIGVDGTTESDLKLLIDHCSITPQIYRGDLSQALDGYGKQMGARWSRQYYNVGDLLKDKNITFLARDAVGNILDKKDVTPNAYGLMQILGKVIFHSHRKMPDSQEGLLQSIINSEDEYYTVPQLALSYLVRHQVVPLPHAYKSEYVVDVSPVSVGGLANFLTERRVVEIGAALKALVTGKDLPEDHGLGTEEEDTVAIVFHNEFDEDVTIIHHTVNSSSLIDKRGAIEGGDSNVFIAHTGDQFEIYHRDGYHIGIYEVRAGQGDADHFTISAPT